MRSQIARRRARYGTLPKCATENCGGKATRVKSGLCEVCYCRVRRTGTVVRLPHKRRYKTGAGYIKLLKPEHPLAESGGLVAEHRYVMFNLLGAAIQKCGWCGCCIDWSDVVVDHLNEQKDDNEPSNLMLACNDCNRARGAMMPFLRGLGEQSFEKLIEVMRAYRAKTARGE